MLTPMEFIISPEYGAAVKNTGGNQLNGLAGNLASFVNNMRYFAESGYSNIAKNYLLKQPGAHMASPQIVKDDSGRFVWRFDGKQNVAFPTNTIYPYSGFEIKISFTPAKVRGTQTLLSSSHAGFRLLLKKGVPAAEYYRANVAVRPVASAVATRKLEIGKPVEIVVRFDQKTLQLIVDGKVESSVPCSGYQLYPQALSVGLDVDGKGFKGDISALSIRPH